MDDTNSSNSAGNEQALVKDPQDWKSGDDPATPAQESYLRTLADQTGEDVPEGMTKAAASEKIDQLRGKAGLGESEEGNGEPPYRMTPVPPAADR